MPTMGDPPSTPCSVGNPLLSVTRVESSRTKAGDDNLEEPGAVKGRIVSEEADADILRVSPLVLACGTAYNLCLAPHASPCPPLRPGCFCRRGSK